jgi:hypothetical protein
MYELNVRITPFSTVIARIDALEPACHLAQLLRVASGFRTCVRCPDGTVLGDADAIGVSSYSSASLLEKTNSFCFGMARLGPDR